MMRAIHISLAVATMALLVSLPVLAGGSWQEKEYGTIQGLRSMIQVGDTYFAAGNNGNVIVSTDGAETWSLFEQNASVYWQAMGIQGDRLWMIGEGGAMRESTDAGVTWQNVTTDVSENLYDVDASDGSAYLVGAGGRIMSFHPEAKIWLSQTSPVTVALNAVQDVGNDVVWAVGSEGYLVQTPDAGANWYNKGRVADDELHGVWFTSGTDGWVVGRNGTVRKTTDAASSWSSVSISGITTQTLYDVAVSEEEIVIVGDKVLTRSEDGGVTWQTTDYTQENYLFRDAYLSDEGIWAVGTKDDIASVMLLFEAEETVATEEEVIEEVENVVEPEEVTESVEEAEPGNLIKLVCEGGEDVNAPCRSVYYYATDGYRHAFPNENVFFTWFDNFDDVIEVSKDFLSDISLGKNVTYHPGTRMVKFVTVPTVYAVVMGGELREVSSEAVAAALYGEDWNTKIDDISDAFYGNYSFGEVIESSGDYDLAVAFGSVDSLDDNF